MRSGYLAAEGILKNLGRAEKLLRPDLPSGPLARLLLGPPSPSRPRLIPPTVAGPATRATRRPVGSA